jgi:hypothetical protein
VQTRDVEAESRGAADEGHGPSGTPVPFQLIWLPNHTAASARNPDAHYKVGKLGEFGSDWECELVLPEGSIYIGIYLAEAKARAAAEYYELTEEIPPTDPPVRRALPESRPEPLSTTRKVAMWAGVIVAVRLTLALGLYLSGVEFR